ncbi:SNF2-related protein [Flavonifractor plautii]|uniref:SNF2-related protein n=2 Tax=Flavonifractor plautii TaxID=292800 RepID=UPI001896BCAF
MNAKERFYSGMARETISKITASKENWTAFLTTMARNYEFTYPEQVMIYAQRPNATFCKPYDEWNDEKYHRYVKRGSTGIALFVTSGNKPYLRYVFDVADTGIRRSSPELKAWEVTAENRAFLMSAMELSFGVKAEGLLEAQLEDIAMTLATEYWADHQKPFLDIVANSFLEEYDELNIEVAFKTTVANSVAYTMYSRLVENPDHYFEHEDFQKVFDFNSRQTVNALGTAVNEISTRMFQEIEKAIDEFEQSKDTERSEYDERDDLQTGWGLQNSGYGAGEPERQNPGQVWQDAQSISGAEQSNASERPDFDGETVPASVGDRGRSERQNGTADEAVSGTESGTGQGNRPDGLGKTHEQPESTGRGSRDDGAYQQLSLNLFPSENEQISFIDRAESFTLSAFSFAQEAIDHFLLLGSNTDEARKIVVLEYMKQKSTEEIVQTLKQVYHGGFGLKEESGNISAWYAEDGIHLAKGASAIDSPRAQVIPWEDTVSRIGELLEQGKFATNVELEEAAGYERMGVAQSIWYLYHDLSDEARNMGFFPSLTDIQGNGFPKETEWLAEQLDQPEFLEALKAEYRSFITTHDTDRSLLRFHYHKLDVLGKRLDELNIPLKEYQSEMMYVPLVRQFITDDEINADMTRGSDFAGGKARIYEYWQEPHSTQERADFLKHEFGIGGHSHACSGATHSGQEHDAKGIRYQKSGCDNVQMSWTQVVQRIDSLMKKGRYLTAEEEVERQEIEDAKADPLEDVYDRFAVIDTEDGEYAIWDNQTDDYYVDHEGVTEYFTDEWLANDYLEEVRQTVVAMENVQSEVPVEEVAEVSDGPIPEVSEWNYQVGDTVYLDDTAFRIEQIKEREVQLRDHSLSYPIFRVENREIFERMLAQDERNQSVKAGAVVEGKPVPAVNFHITDDHIGEGGPKQKFARNIEAIETLFKLENEDRNATPEEQEILANFVGWGGLSDAFDPDKGNWAQEYMTLKNMLSEDEYAAARASTLNAHYTSPTVIRSIYDTVGQMGFETGNILEPSMGIGNFFGMLPPEMQSSRLYGVELDSITGRIAQKLYPNAEIKVAGFETTDRRDFYDLAVGNVPFGNYKVSDKPYDKLGFSIHNYFFAKALDQVRPGGVVAFVTSRYTMDSKNSDARRHLAQRAELLGAIRLPNDAFKKNAGTEVVSDIIFLQKRDHPIDIVPDWVHLNRTDDGHTMNSYFVEHPEMILGETVEESTAYGIDITVRPIEGAELSDLLKEAVSHIEGIYQAVELPEAEKGKEAETIPATPDVKNFSYTVVDGEVYFRENSIMRHLDLNEKAKERVAGMVELRGIVNELIEYQLEDFPDEMISQKQAELNIAYDAFTAKHGLINHRANAQAFAEDSSYYLLCSLENVDEDGKLKSKADMFTKRTIKPERRVTSVDTPSEALAISIGARGKVDLPFMAQLLGTPEEYDTIKAELQGVIFKDPMGPDAPEASWQTADEYLSGDVRSKLRIAEMAAKQDSSFNINVEALQKAQPKDLDASEIDVRLGATWIDPDYIQQFMQETFETPYYLRRAIEVKFSEMTAEWRINGKSAPNYNDVAAYMTYGTDRANAYRILEETLNLKDIRIYDTIEDPDGKQKRVLNKKETTLAQQKQQAIKDAFRDWIWKDPRRREALVTKYNELFNSTRPREYDGSHIRFGGMNPDITLREHQRNAIAHVLYGGNTLLAHEVGAGKTFEMAASAMESKRLGLSQKSMFVVPNHLTLQWANEFLRLYPSAKLLVATKKDFETANRKKFCARIATGDYDAVIIGHSQFERIPLSAERQERQLREQIDEIEGAIAELKYQRGENFTIKQMEKTRKSLEARLDKLLAADKKDDVINFEQLGVDRLFVDESHAFKNLFLYTKMRNVAGLSTSEAQKSSDMFMKCRYMDEITGGRGVVFATGTPVSNSMTELYTVMRYLQYGTLQQKNLTHFDSWASTFGETTTAIELAPEGTGYRARTRFAKFFNLPELMNMFKEVADIKTSDQLNLPVPDAKFETVVVQPSEHQQDMVAELSERAAAVHAGIIDPSEDNMLKITTDGRKIGLDQRLMNPLLPDDPNSKLNACVGNVLRIWQDGQADKLTQLVFCDFSTPKNDGTFNVYDDIKSKLLAAGVPSEEVAFIHNADTEAKKKELFAKVRTGQVRVLLGSTQKMGAGTNVQDKLVAVHHLDVGWRPSDMTQRNGRIIRQGNQNKEVQVYQYVTEGTFDAYLYQTLENKQKFISQIMTSKSPVRSCDDVDEQALSYAEIKALCAGNPLIKEKMDLDIEVARLKVLKADHQSQQYRMEDKLLKYFPAEIERQTGYIHGFEADIKTVEANPQIVEGFCGMDIRGKHYSEKADAGEWILAACKEVKGSEPVPLGEYRGFQMELSFDSFRHEFDIVLKGSMSHRVALGTDARGNITRLDNALASVPDRLEKAKEQLSNLYNQQEATKSELGKPFPQETELTAKSQRLAELDAALNMEDSADSRDELSNTDRPSVLADLKSKSEQIPPVKRSDAYEEVL